MVILALFIALVAAQDAGIILKHPFYFGVSRVATESIPVTCANTRPYGAVWSPSDEDPSVGLRVIPILNGPSRAERQQARRKMASDLAASGVLQDGDIVLTFRPEMANSMAYPHIQMGVTHAGLVYTREDGTVGHVAAFNIDSPMDNLYMGQFDSAHYAGDGAEDAGVDAIHFVRPRGFNEQRRKQLREWISILQKALGRFNGERAQVKFQPDYMKPAFLTTGSPVKSATMLGKILLEQDKTTKLPMFCSEFAYHMLALSACTPDQIRNTQGNEASCVQLLFNPMPLTATSATEVGLADGPFLNLLPLQGAGRAQLLKNVFCAEGSQCNGGAKLSSGHRAVAQQVAPLMAGLQKIFEARLAGAPMDAVAPNARELNNFSPPNYSPTAFFVRAFAMGDRALDYVATVVFLGARDYERVKPIISRTCAQLAPPRAESGNANQCIRDTGEARAAQQALIRLQYLPVGSDDGQWGRMSQGALNKFQAQQRVSQTTCLTGSDAEALRRVR